MIGMTRITLRNVIYSADDLEEELSTEEITNALQETEKAADDEEAVDDKLSTETPYQEGFAAWNKALFYFEQQPKATPADLLILNRWRNIAAKNRKMRYETGAHR